MKTEILHYHKILDVKIMAKIVQDAPSFMLLIMSNSDKNA